LKHEIKLNICERNVFLFSSSNHIQAEASNHFFLTHGNGAQPLFPNFSNCDTKSMKMTFASAETPVALQ
jgi:hypothetical protein